MTWLAFAHLDEAEHGLSVRAYTLFDRERRRAVGFEFIGTMLEPGDGFDLVLDAVDPAYAEERANIRPPAPLWCSRCGGALERRTERFCWGCESYDIYTNGPAMRREALKGLGL